MRSTLINVATALAIVLIATLTWLGQQRPPDRYLEGIEARGVLRVGIDPSYPPFESVKDGKIEGYDAELARAIASDLSVQVEFVPLALDTLYDALIAEKVDVLISALPFIYERQKEIRYSTSYYQAGQVLVVRSGEKRIASIKELQGKRVGVELGSTADTEARRLTRTSITDMDLDSSYQTPDEALDALAQGKVDAAIADNTSAQAYERTHPGAITILSPPLTDEPYVIAMPAKANQLASRVNATIERLREAGELARMMGLPEE
ncbi:MAG TPA: ABC transporter substrate-binding protein [Chloroflexia bacterium]|nr:ABC transporter substrate-binding protein [Chloroflexia bacterium]